MSGFTELFSDYGSSPTTLTEEIKTDLKRSLMTSLGTRPFSRDEGFDLRQILSEKMTEEKILLTKFAIANATAVYNQNSSPDRQVLVSQSYIDIYEGNTRGTWFIDIIYIIPSLVDLDPDNAVNTLTIGL